MSIQDCNERLSTYANRLFNSNNKDEYILEEDKEHLDSKSKSKIKKKIKKFKRIKKRRDD